METAIQLDRLSKNYAQRAALVELTLQVNKGEVIGYLGPNGAGKSTTIRLLLDLIRPSGGSVTVLGLHPRKAAVELHRRLGYLPGDFTVDGRQTVRECLAFFGGLRGGVAMDRIAALAARLDLDLTPKIASLSKGNRQKVGLVQAFMHDPELLILDEPTSGLDPLAQETFLQLVREARDEGRTVFMSSHIMSEVQAVADRVAIIRQGRLVALDSVANLRQQAVRQVEIVFAGPAPREQFTALEGVTGLSAEKSTLRCTVTGSPDALIKAAAKHTVLALTCEEPDLEALFHDYYRKDSDHAAA